MARERHHGSRGVAIEDQHDRRIELEEPAIGLVARTKLHRNAFDVADGQVALVVEEHLDLPVGLRMEGAPEERLHAFGVDDIGLGHPLGERGAFPRHIEGQSGLVHVHEVHAPVGRTIERDRDRVGRHREAPTLWLDAGLWLEQLERHLARDVEDELPVADLDGEVLVAEGGEVRDVGAEVGAKPLGHGLLDDDGVGMEEQALDRLLEAKGRQAAASCARDAGVSAANRAV